VLENAVQFRARFSDIHFGMLLFICFIFSLSPTFGQSLETFDVEAGGSAAYEGRFSQGDLSWDRLKPDLTATLKPGSSVYSRPDFAVSEKNLSALPWNYWRERCTRSKSQPSLDGRLMYVSGNIAAVQLNQPANFCGSYFNADQEDRRLVFVKRENIADLIPSGEEHTEATALPERCPGCEKSELAEVMKQMSAAAAQKGTKSCHKTEEEMERYLKCHATRHQANYDKYYRKLMNLAGQTFQAAYTPGERDGVRAILKPEDSQVNGKTLPFLVGAKANVLKCIALRESMWDPTAVSGGKDKNGKPLRGGAMGLGQQTNTNVTHMKCLLEGCSRQVRVEVRDAAGRVTMTTKTENVRPQKWAVDLWQEYFRRVKATLTPEELRELYRHPVTGKRCSETMALKERDAPCPINSIAALAIYQIEAELTIRRNSPLYKNTELADFNESERCDLMVVQGSTNNAGTGTTAGAVRSATKPSQWRAQLRANTGNPNDHGIETDNFSRYLTNCLAAGNWNSMHPLRKGEKPKDCSAVSAR